MAAEAPGVCSCGTSRIRRENGGISYHGHGNDLSTYREISHVRGTSTLLQNNIINFGRNFFTPSFRLFQALLRQFHQGCSKYGTLRNEDGRLFGGHKKAPKIKMSLNQN